MAEGRQLAEDAAESERCKRKDELRARKASQELRDSRRAQVAVRECDDENDQNGDEQTEHNICVSGVSIYIYERDGDKESKAVSCRVRAREEQRKRALEGSRVGGLYSIIRQKMNVNMPTQQSLACCVELDPCW